MADHFSFPRRRSVVECLLRGTLAGLLLAICLHVGYVLAGSNFHTVLPGQVYRIGQPTPALLERMIQKHGIRTVVNLRGTCVTAPWYQAEAAVTARLGIDLEDISFSATRLPSTAGVRRLLEVLDRAEYPLLIHCQQGADRTGLACALAVLLRMDATLAQARDQLSLTYAHVSFGKTGHIDRFLDTYERWLEVRGETHTPDRLRHWATAVYCPNEGRAEYALLDPATLSEAGRPALRIRAWQPSQLTVRCTNRSPLPWHFTPDNTAGVHAFWRLFDLEEKVMQEDRRGLFHATVAPGEHIDLAITLVCLPPGKYQLRMDMASEQHASFLQLGNDLFVVEVEVQ